MCLKYLQFKFNQWPSDFLNNLSDALINLSAPLKCQSGVPMYM